MNALMTDLQDWCLQQLSLSAEDLAQDLSVVSGDASFRCYYRLFLGDGRSVIAVHAPPDKEDNIAFARVQKLLYANGARVPALLAWDKPRGYLLQEDFGDQLLLPLLTDRAAAVRYYGQAQSLLLAVQGIPLAAGQLPDYDVGRLHIEMDLFPQWFIRQLLGYELSGNEERLLNDVFSALSAQALSQPQLMVHRDFHSRNIMCLNDGLLGMIDFQDAVRGPLTYDLVSLLRDCYVAWPPADVRVWALAYRDAAVEAGLIESVSDDIFLRWFDWMGMQRHIKVLGIFARLKLRDGKTAYLKDLPLVMAYTLDVARQYETFTAFVAWFEEKLLPLAKAQDWYREIQL